MSAPSTTNSDHHPTNDAGSASAEPGGLPSEREDDADQGPASELTKSDERSPAKPAGRQIERPAAHEREDAILPQNISAARTSATQERPQSDLGGKPLVSHEAGKGANDGQEPETAYEEVAPQELLPPPDFKPYFTLVEDSRTGEHHHPNIHYLFADDDADLLTNAALDAISMGQALNNGEALEHEERIMILDMTSDGREVVAARSLSPQWQALKTTITQPPSWGAEASATGKGMMLTISGRKTREMWESKGMSGTNDDPDDLTRTFAAKLKSLDDILGSEEEEATDKEPTDAQATNT